MYNTFNQINEIKVDSSDHTSKTKFRRSHAFIVAECSTLLTYNHWI